MNDLKRNRLIRTILKNFSKLNDLEMSICLEQQQRYLINAIYTHHELKATIKQAVELKSKHTAPKSFIHFLLGRW